MASTWDFGTYHIGEHLEGSASGEPSSRTQVKKHSITYTKDMIPTVFGSLFDLILYVPSTIFRLNRDGSSLVEPVLS